MPEVRAVETFFDVAGKEVRNVGDEWNCDDARAGMLSAAGMVVVIGVPAQEPEPGAEEKAPTQRRTRKKKAD